MIISDPHLIGPVRGHWYDRLRREWQMKRSFHAANILFKPDVVFILGDLFDEGDLVEDPEFYDYVSRFHDIFSVPKTTRIINVAGNHDVGFHYRMYSYFLDRFADKFNHTGVELVSIKDVHFIIINSMAMENDGCEFCSKAMKELDTVSRKLKCLKIPEKCGLDPLKVPKYSLPIVMQHFPTFRESDQKCIEGDSPEFEVYRENWEVLSKKSTAILGNKLNPRLVFGGHSHHFCRLTNTINVEEYTVASFSWRNKNNPSFLLAKFNADKHSISLCNMPKESTQRFIYTIMFLSLFILFICYGFKMRTNRFLKYRKIHSDDLKFK
ncbi:MPPE1 family protein [Megaselia abdita]